MLSAEAHRGAELDFPTAGGAIQKEKIRTSGFTLIEIGGPVTVREAVWLGAVQWVVGAEDKAEVLGADQVFGSTMVGEPELLVRIMDISSQDAHCMRQVGSRPNREVDEFAMVSPHFGAHVDVDFGRTVFLTVDNIGVKRSSDSSSGFRIVTVSYPMIASLPADTFTRSSDPQRRGRHTGSRHA